MGRGTFRPRHPLHFQQLFASLVQKAVSSIHLPQDETQEAHCICAGCQTRAFRSSLAPAYLLPHEKTKTDGDKRRTGGGLMRSLHHGSATCEAAFMQTLAPTVLVLGVESHSLRRRSPPHRAGCCVQVVGLPWRHSWETMRVVASWVRFRKAERNPAFLLASLSWQDRCN